MLNAVGLQNKGVDYFIEHIYPRLTGYDTEVMVNISGASVSDYVEVCERLAECGSIHAIEVNISCPNVKQGVWHSAPHAKAQVKSHAPCAVLGPGH